MGVLAHASVASGTYATAAEAAVHGRGRPCHGTLFDKTNPPSSTTDGMHPDAPACTQMLHRKPMRKTNPPQLFLSQASACAGFTAGARAVDRQIGDRAPNGRCRYRPCKTNPPTSSQPFNRASRSYNAAAVRW